MAGFQIDWQAPEYEFREKGVSWYWISIIVAAVIVAFSVWQRNFLFGVFIVIAEILFLVWGSHMPRIVSFSLTETALSVPGKIHLLKEFEAMSIDDLGNGWTELILYTRARLRTPLKVLLPENRTDELRKALAPTLREVPYEPTLLDAIEKLLRF